MTSDEVIEGEGLTKLEEGSLTVFALIFAGSVLVMFLICLCVRRLCRQEKAVDDDYFHAEPGKINIIELPRQNYYFPPMEAEGDQSICE